MANFPTSKDDATSLPNPTGSSTQDNPDHGALHTNENAAIIALESKVGTGATTPTNNTILRGDGAGTSSWGQVTSAQLAAIISDETGSGSAVFANTPTLVTPKVDTINEATSGNGVIIDGVILKDGAVTGAVDGSNLVAETVTAAKMQNRTRSINMLFFAEGANGATSSVSGGMPQVAFAGTPSGFMRCSTMIPADYVAGTDVTIRIKTYATNTATHTARRYVNAAAVGDSVASFWDVDSNVQTTNLVYAANTLKDIDVLVAAANIATDSLLSMAWRIETAITGTVYVDNVSLRYTADS